jgi:uncharacterized LabA/DUF88 family protein
MPTAILIDGAFFVHRFREIEPLNAYDPDRAAQQAWRWAVAHLIDKNSNSSKHELYRIFFYDCPPLENKMLNPISGNEVDLRKLKEASFRTALHDSLRKKRKVALRLGHLSGDATWTIRPDKIQAILKKKITSSDLTEKDVMPQTRQKGVDMRIGLDIASLAFKKQVKQIVLIVGDADFIPAAKLARREGIDFILDPMWNPISPGLREHIDGLRTTCPNPKPGRP